jgi:hypothetical protein
MTENEKLDLLYQENAKVAAIFWEWRHKVMTAFFAVIAALFALAGWFYQQSELRTLLFAPLALGAIFCLASFALDFRNAAILRECYRIGEEIEIQLRDEGAIFKSIRATHYSGATYTIILRAVYAAVGILLLALSYRAYSLFR